MDPNTCESVSEFVSRLSKKEAKELLAKWREENSRHSELVREIWLSIDLCSYLGDEKWIVLEQVCIAAMDLNDKQLIKECLNELQAKFSNSNRVARLRMMANLELNERYSDAIEQYSSLIAKDESNSLLYKRKIAILVAARQTTEAIKVLCDYLQKFMNDHEAWIQLSSLYIQEQEYTKAAFCLEELILTSPQNHLYHEKYAEIQYTIGTPDSLELARAYFAQSVRLKPNSVRGLYGLIVSANMLASLSKTTSQKKKECAKSAAWAVAKLNEIYKQQTHLANVDSLLSALTISS